MLNLTWVAVGCWIGWTVDAALRRGWPEGIPTGFAIGVTFCAIAGKFGGVL